MNKPFPWESLVNDQDSLAQLFFHAHGTPCFLNFHQEVHPTDVFDVTLFISGWFIPLSLTEWPTVCITFVIRRKPIKIRSISHY